MMLLDLLKRRQRGAADESINASSDVVPAVDYEGTGEPRLLPPCPISDDDTDAFLLLSRLTGLKILLEEEVRRLLHEPILGDLDCKRIRAYSLACEEALASLPAKIEEVESWIKQFCRKRQELRGATWQE